MALKEYSTDNIRNIALISSRWSRKDYARRRDVVRRSGGNDWFGRTDDGHRSLTSTLEEQRRNTTISTSIARLSGKVRASISWIPRYF